MQGASNCFGHICFFQLIVKDKRNLQQILRKRSFWIGQNTAAATRINVHSVNENTRWDAGFGVTGPCTNFSYRRLQSLNAAHEQRDKKLLVWQVQNSLFRNSSALIFTGTLNGSDFQLVRLQKAAISTKRPGQFYGLSREFWLIRLKENAKAWDWRDLRRRLHLIYY